MTTSQIIVAIGSVLSAVNTLPALPQVTTTLKNISTQAIAVGKDAFIAQLSVGGADGTSAYAAIAGTHAAAKAAAVAVNAGFGSQSSPLYIPDFPA